MKMKRWRISSQDITWTGILKQPTQDQIQRILCSFTLKEWRRNESNDYNDNNNNQRNNPALYNIVIVIIVKLGFQTNNSSAFSNLLYKTFLEAGNFQKLSYMVLYCFRVKTCNIFVKAILLLKQTVVISQGFFIDIVTCPIYNGSLLRLSNFIVFKLVLFCVTLRISYFSNNGEFIRNKHLQVRKTRRLRFQRNHCVSDMPIFFNGGILQITTVYSVKFSQIKMI